MDIVFGIYGKFLCYGISRVKKRKRFRFNGIDDKFKAESVSGIKIAKRIDKARTLRKAMLCHRGKQIPGHCSATS